MPALSAARAQVFVPVRLSAFPKRLCHDVEKKAIRMGRLFLYVKILLMPHVVFHLVSFQEDRLVGCFKVRCSDDESRLVRLDYSLVGCL